jgi:hypothetical protein
MTRVLPRTCDFVFPGERGAGKPIRGDALSEPLERVGIDCTVRGFRSTFRDWAAETTAYPNHVVEMAIAHPIGNQVEAAYRRGDLFEKHTELMAVGRRTAAAMLKRLPCGSILKPANMAASDRLSVRAERSLQKIGERTPEQIVTKVFYARREA